MAVSKLLNAVTTSTTSSSVELVVGRRYDWLVYDGGPGGIDTVYLEGSPDGSTWVALASANAATGPTQVDRLIKFVRARYDQSVATGAVSVWVLQSDV